MRDLPPEKVPAYLAFTKAELGEQVAIYLRLQRWLCLSWLTILDSGLA